MAEVTKPHLVCVPFPAQSHISAMVKLAKLLHQKGFHITFVNTELSHNRILKARGPHSLDGLPNFKFHTIPDGLAPSDSNHSTRELGDVISLMKKGADAFSNLLERLNKQPGIPPVTCIVSDGSLAFTLAVAEQIGVPIALFWTISACGFMGYQQLPDLVQKGLLPLKGNGLLIKDKFLCHIDRGGLNGSIIVVDESYLSINGFSDAIINWIPGMESFIRLKDLHAFVRSRDPHDVALEFFIEQTERSRKVSANIFHTFDALERDVLDALSPVLPSLFAVGPLQLLQTQASEEEEEAGSKSIGFNLWKEDFACLEWLDAKEPGTVLYVNFGSIVQITSQQLIEIGWGLANSQCNFLWIVRQDLVTGESAYLSPEFEAEIKERGLITRWCPQEKVLNHPSVGGFFTHSGWSSLLESLSAGVPMICWPFLGDQPMNCRYICSEWRVGVEMNGDDVKREKVEKLVRQLMEGDEGVKLKMKAVEWKKLAEEAAGRSDGSSVLDFDNLVKKLKILSRART